MQQSNPTDKNKGLELIEQSMPDIAADAALTTAYEAELEGYSTINDEEEESYRRKIELAYHIRQLKQLDSVLSERTDYAKKIYRLVKCWLVAIFLILILVGCKVLVLDVKVLIALISGTTINVLGIFTVVANFLFPKNGYELLTKVVKDKKEAKVKKAVKAKTTK